jgi:hypothetical protein
MHDCALIGLEPPIGLGLFIDQWSQCHQASGAETRWAGVIHMLDWVVKYKVILKAYDTNPAEDTCENPDGSKYGDHMLDDDDGADAEELVSVVIGAQSYVYSVSRVHPNQLLDSNKIHTM